MLDGIGEGSSNTSAEIASTEGTAGYTAETNSEFEKGNVSEDFMKSLAEMKQNAGLKTEPDAAKADEVIKPEEKELQKVPAEKTVIEPDSAEKKEGEEDSDELKTPTGEAVKATRIAEVKEWGKGWQKTAEAAKPALDFITERYNGSMEEAEISANLFEKILGTEVESFNPVEIFNELAEISKPRAEKLIEFFATNDSVQKMAESRVIEKVFGKDLSAEELQEDLEGYKLFKQAGGLSALIGEDGELPAQLQYDAEGNPRPEEEVNIFKSFLSELKGIKTDRQKDAEAKAEAERVERQAAEQGAIGTYTEERFNGVKTAIKNVGLEIAPTDSEEVKAAKTRDSRMINFYVAGMASEDNDFKKIYKEAIDALKSGDNFTANRKKIQLNAKIAGYTSEIVDDYIAKNNIKIDTTKTKIDKALETRKEINLGAGGEVTAPSTRPANESVEDAIARLKREGKLRSE